MHECLDYVRLQELHKRMKGGEEGVGNLANERLNPLAFRVK